MEEEERITATGESDEALSDDGGSESDAELMVTSRVRRITAGNRYNAVVGQEQEEQDAEDDVAMLFAEIEGEDEEYNSDAGDDDEHMSSSDDDDQGPNAGPEDMEGEKELQKEAKAERARKRKADLAMTTMSSIRKKPRIDPTALRGPAPKLSKRKERVSWLPGEDVSSGRTSLRKQTIAHREETHAKLKENEALRLKAKARREKREKERAAVAPRELTQEDRLEEAARVEKKNAKSLNRWEAAEKVRAQEQAAKLAALKDRRLKGTVVTWYSTRHKYYGLKEDDQHEEIIHEPKKRGRKPKAFHEQRAAQKLAEANAASTAPTTDLAPAPAPANTDPAPSTSTQLEPGSDQTGQSLQQHHALLTGIEDYASSPTETTIHQQPAKVESAVTQNPTIVDEQTIRDPPRTAEHIVLSAPATGPDDSAAPPEATSDLLPKRMAPEQPSIRDLSPQITGAEQLPVIEDAEIIQKARQEQEPQTNQSDHTSEPLKHQPDLKTPHAVSNGPEPFDQPQATLESPNTIDVGSQETREEPPMPDSISKLNGTTGEAQDPRPADPTLLPALPPMPPPKPLIEVISTRNLVILDRFDELPSRDRSQYAFFSNNRKTGKPTKHVAEMCALTGLPVKYRDPSSGIGYANSIGFKKLQDLKKHQYTWSSMLGCYVGRTGSAARGVPEGFAD